jgi:hypothetical protein
MTSTDPAVALVVSPIDPKERARGLCTSIGLRMVTAAAVSVARVVSGVGGAFVVTDVASMLRVSGAAEAVGVCLSRYCPRI